MYHGCCVDHMEKAYKQLFGKKPRGKETPLLNEDKIELDTSPFIDEEDIEIYQPLISSNQL